MLTLGASSHREMRETNMTPQGRLKRRFKHAWTNVVRKPCLLERSFMKAHSLPRQQQLAQAHAGKTARAAAEDQFQYWQRGPLRHSRARLLKTLR